MRERKERKVAVGNELVELVGSSSTLADSLGLGLPLPWFHRGQHDFGRGRSRLLSLQGG